MNKTKMFLDKQYISIGGYIAVKLFWLVSKVLYRTEYNIRFDRPLKDSEVIVFASNHANKLDPPAIFSALPSRQLFREIAPIKFMTSTKYYNSWMRPILYATGCFAHKGPGRTGVEGSVFFAQNGYRVFIFPEGRMNPTYQLGHAYEGVSRILAKFPDARLVLVHIYWGKKKHLFDRPILSVTFTDAPATVDRSDPFAIMKAVYATAPAIATDLQIAVA